MQDGDDRIQALSDAQSRRLDDEIVAVAIDDDGWEQVGFAVDDAVRGGVNRQRLPEGERVFDPLSDQRVVCRLLGARQHAERDLRFVAVEGRPERPPAAQALHDHAVAGLRPGGLDVTAVDPRMARSKAFFPAC